MRKMDVISCTLLEVESVIRNEVNYEEAVLLSGIKAI
jgi:hypothetical protein